jgi:hypothetical protein
MEKNVKHCTEPSGKRLDEVILKSKCQFSVQFCSFLWVVDGVIFRKAEILYDKFDSYLNNQVETNYKLSIHLYIEHGQLFKYFCGLKYLERAK